MVPVTTPASLTYCPNCASKGNNYHPNGQWSWDKNNPDQIKCSKCGMVFPNDAWPETLQYRSTFDPEQTITYVDNGPKKCMNYLRCYSSVAGVLRAKKLQYTIKRLIHISQAYALTGDAKYAEGAKRFLLKLADRFPKYMVYCGYSYNQYADCDPHVVVQTVPKLPLIDNKQCPIIVADPELAGNSFFTGYWATSRFGTSGSDGEYVQILAEAYDFVADALREDGSPVFTDEEKEHIEKDLLIESCLLCYFDKAINNKSTLNRKSCTIVGLVVGNAKLVRFGLDGFNKVFDEFFLKDGTTSQSVTYGLKTLLGFDGFHLAFRNYTDPSYYVPEPGEVAYKNFNINKDTDYESLWYALMWCSNPNGIYPIIGDESFGNVFPTDYYEFLTTEYKHDYLQKYIGSLQNKQSLPHNNGIFLREPDYVPYDGEFTLPDFIYPYLQQGYIRSGERGLDSILVLDASLADAGHHHRDSLNIIYTKHNYELLMDLGYLIDHPNQSKTTQTVVHHTVLVDGYDQEISERGGQFHLFDATMNDTKIMQASSHPYPKLNVDTYHRTLVQLEHENGEDYVVDIFRCHGGLKRRELVVHGPNNNYSMKNPLKFTEPYEVKPLSGYIQFSIRNTESFEIADISMYEIHEDDTKGKELISEIPAKLEVPNNGVCSENTMFCLQFNQKRGNLDYSIVEGPEKNKRAIKVLCTPTSSAKTCSGEFFVGHPNKKFSLRDNMRLMMQFKIKGTSFANNLRLNISGSMTRLTKTNLWNIQPDKWNLFTGYFNLGVPFSDAMGTKTNDPVSITWKIDKDMDFSVFAPARKDQKVYFKNGWGQRYKDNRDFGAKLPYFFFTRDINENMSTYVTIYEGCNNHSIVKGVESIDDGKGNVVVRIDTLDGYDYVASSFNDGDLIEGYGLKTDAKVAVVNNGKTRVYNGNVFTFNGKIIKENKVELSGNVVSNKNSDDRAQSWYDIEGSFDIESIRPGQILFVKGDDNISRGYPIVRSQKVSDSIRRIFVKYDYEGFKSYPANAWNLIDLKTELIDGPKDNGSKGKKLSKGGVAAIVIVVIIVVAALVAVGVFFYLKKKNEGGSESNLMSTLAA